jgi:uncharacterized Tic20 family protein
MTGYASPPEPGWATGPGDEWRTGPQPAVGPGLDGPGPGGPAADPAPPPGGTSTGGWEWLTARPAPPASVTGPVPVHAPPPVSVPPPAQAPPPGYVTGPTPAVQALMAAGDQERAASRHSRRARGLSDGDEAWAMLGYLGVPFISILAPLTVYLARSRRSPFVRQQATQALNFAITMLLYNLCVLIMAGILALDEVGIALAVAGPVALGLWLAALYFLARAAIKASTGEFYAIPSWICATFAR